MKSVHKIAQTKAFKQVGAKYVGVTIPGCENHERFTDAYWECHVYHLAANSYHPMGTCKMGSVDDPTTVVDSQLR